MLAHSLTKKRDTCEHFHALGVSFVAAFPAALSQRSFARCNPRASMLFTKSDSNDRKFLSTKTVKKQWCVSICLPQLGNADCLVHCVTTFQSVASCAVLTVSSIACAILWRSWSSGPRNECSMGLLIVSHFSFVTASNPLEHLPHSHESASVCVCVCQKKKQARMCQLENVADLCEQRCSRLSVLHNNLATNTNVSVFPFPLCVL